MYVDGSVEGKGEDERPFVWMSGEASHGIFTDIGGE
jgi:hypothetical protein